MRITNQVSLFNVTNYPSEFTPTESSAGGTLLYIANHLTCKCCNSLDVYKKYELESTFNEIFNPQKSRIIVGVIYRNLFMYLSDFRKIHKQILRGNLWKNIYFCTWRL